MIAAPLIAGNDIRKMSKETQEVLTNKEVIAVNQDKLGIQGFKLSANDGLETWLKPLDGGKWAMVFLNRSKEPRAVNFDWSKTPIVDELSKAELNAAKTTYKVRNLWTKKDIGNTKKAFKATVPSHDVVMLLLSK
jgi:alpha-galactosidase